MSYSTPDAHLIPSPSVAAQPQRNLRVLWVGIGCQRGTPKAVIEQAIQQVFQAYHLVETAIAGIATLDLKANEIGLVEFCRDRSLPFIGFSASALQAIAVPSPSPLVASTTRTPSVAEAAALQAASQFSIPLSLLPLDSEPPNSEPPNSEPPNLQPPTPNPPSLLVPKQIFRFPNYSGAVTIAVAQAQQEYLEKHK